MTDVATLDEWIAYAEEAVDPCARVVGEWANVLRDRIGGNRHTEVWLSEDFGGCQCCGYWNRWVITSGDKEARIDIDDGYTHATYLDWLNEPAVRAERLARDAAEQEARRRQAEAVVSSQVSAISDAITAVEAEGYRSDQEWHDKLMTRLGVKH